MWRRAEEDGGLIEVINNPGEAGGRSEGAIARSLSELRLNEEALVLHLWRQDRRRRAGAEGREVSQVPPKLRHKLPRCRFCPPQRSTAMVPHSHAPLTHACQARTPVHCGMHLHPAIVQASPLSNRQR